MLDYDPLFPPDWDSSYTVYRRLRDEAPVFFAARSGTWCISRYADVSSVLRDAATFSSASAFDILMKGRFKGLGPVDVFEIGRFLYRSRLNPLTLLKQPPPSLINCDPPQHSQLRAIVNRGFTPARIKEWEVRVREIVESCMQNIRGRDSFDLVHDLAIPLPVTVIAEMLGIDSARRTDFKRWSDAIIAGSSGPQTPETLRSFLRAVGELVTYVRKVAADRRRAPRGDLISVLVDPEHQDVLDDGALGQFVIVLLVGGNETTTNLIGNAVNTLLGQPQLLERLIAEPELLPGLIEESLRYESPLQMVFRRTTRACEIAGVPIPAGASVTALVGSANRDERRFEDPDRFDPSRTTRSHLGFGFGIHACLGAALARLEARAAFEVLLPELTTVKRARSATSFADSFMVRGLSSLPLTRIRSANSAVAMRGG